MIPEPAVDRLAAMLRRPDLSGTRYEIVSELGRGGMGVVYLARDTTLDREVALKIVDRPSGAGNEARIIARLEHPGIVPVHDFGELPDGRLFYAMKCVRGDRLDRWTASGPDLVERLGVFLRVCDAVAFAHAHGVVHRDLKPENVMVGQFGEVLVLDWGVAKLVDREDRTYSSDGIYSHSGDTVEGTVIGTQNYMSPEQARGEIDQLDERADIYSLGAVLSFLLKDQPKVSKAAQAITSKAMATAKEHRYTSASDLSADIARLLDAEPVSAYRENAIERTSRWVGKNRFLVLLVLAYLLMRIFLIFTSRR